MTLPPFQRLLDDHGPDVHRFLVATAGRDEADDCFQETFIAALRAYPELTDASNLRGWLFTIAHRKALDAHRARSRRAVPAATVPDQPTDPREEDGEVWEHVRALPPKQRAAVTLRFVADLRHADIAHALDCTVPAARRSLHEGLTTLREEWSP